LVFGLWLLVFVIQVIDRIRLASQRQKFRTKDPRAKDQITTLAVVHIAMLSFIFCPVPA